MTLAVFHDFAGLENGLTKFHDFPGRVVTLFAEQTKLHKDCLCSAIPSSLSWIPTFLLTMSSNKFSESFHNLFNYHRNMHH